MEGEAEVRREKNFKPRPHCILGVPESHPDGMALVSAFTFKPESLREENFGRRQTQGSDGKAAGGHLGTGPSPPGLCCL